MATVKTFLDVRYERSDRLFPVRIKINIRRQQALTLNTGIVLPKDSWNNGRIIKHPDALVLNSKLTKLINRINETIALLEEKGELQFISLTDLKVILTQNENNKEKGDNSFVEYFISIIDQCKKDSTRGTYRQTLDKILVFQNNAPLPFGAINFNWLTSFQSFMDKLNLSINTQAIYLRNIRSIFNKGLNNDIFKCADYPFRKFKIKSEKTRKRSLTLEQIRQLRDYPCEPFLEKYRDIFFLIIYLGGINIIDLCNLKEITSDGYIEYRRHKTGIICKVKVEPEAMRLIEKYRGKKTLLNVSNCYSNYRYFAARMNEGLQKIGPVKKVPDKKGANSIIVRSPLFKELTTYWARHTTATLAVELNIHEKVINKILGHADNTINGIYEQVYQRQMDEAMRKIIDFINNDKLDRATMNEEPATYLPPQ